MNIVCNVNGENPKEGVKIVDYYDEDTRGYESEVTERGETSTFLGRIRGSRDAKRVTGVVDACWTCFPCFSRLSSLTCLRNATREIVPVIRVIYRIRKFTISISFDVISSLNEFILVK